MNGCLALGCIVGYRLSCQGGSAYGLGGSWKSRVAMGL